MNLGVQLSKNDLQCLVEHTVERPNGITYQEFVHALTRDDKYHGYANDKDGTGEYQCILYFPTQSQINNV